MCLKCLNNYDWWSKIRLFRDGNAWCAVGPDFINLQESPAGFGELPSEAVAELEQEIGWKKCV